MAKVLVTGAKGKVGRAAVPRLRAAGHDVVATDVARPVFERALPGEAPYVQAELTDAGDAYAVVRGMDAVVHAAALPEPTQNTPHHVFANNLMAMFNVLEAAVRLGVSRFVFISSETVVGNFFPDRPFLPPYLPIDERAPLAPQDPYALAKVFGEQLCDAAVRRSDIRCVSLRPSWVQNADSYERNLGPVVAGPPEPSANFWSYVDADDLADAIALAVDSDLPGHEVFYIANPDNAGGRDFRETVRAVHGEAIEVRTLERPDAAGVSCRKANELLGWRASRSWRDYLDARGRRLPGV